MSYKHFLFITLCLFTANTALAIPEQRVGRYTIVKMVPDQSEVETLHTVKALRFPDYIQDVYAALVHLMQHTGYRLKLDEESRALLSDFRLPQAHREIGPLKVVDALHILLGGVWDIRINQRLREVYITSEPYELEDPQHLSRAVAARQNLGSLQEPVIAHYPQIHLKSLVQSLIPRGWQTSYQIPHDKAIQVLTFHAETTRKRALEQLFTELNLNGTFYPGQGLLLVRPRP